VCLDSRTKVVVMGFDDNTGASELYMYVANSEHDAINGNGKLYVLKTDAKTSSGTNFHSGNLQEGVPIDASFVEVPDPADLGTAPASRSNNLQTKVDALGAMPFVRIEDGDYDKNSPYSPAIYFVDTGNSGVTGRTQVNANCFGVCDLAGSLYRVEWKSRDPLGGVRVRLVERSRGAASGWASPDNIATTRKSLMMMEDPAYSGFDGSRPPAIWHFRLHGDGRKVGQAHKVVEATQETLIPGPTGKCVDALGQCWETSGIISTEEWLGPGTWLFDVQAHTLPFSVTKNGTTYTYGSEGGQLLYLRLTGS
jgi:secreted PhoX family phosphatase